ncbi:diketogulonate reductase-like aldo/keto reductase [Lipingzhangella halophila]|uniref:Diketogulonate reductase-like aldo/keto reductase n=1 Tax=Lipingzhangella halophila TaxID=1783352 RepID=A0A7W7RN08_9ACTN|nr:diketogulonate reductase-like aldo/keto reductase [Lipingzhangella halophila]
MSSIPAVTLNNGRSMPQVGFGVFQVPDAETDAVVATALEAGYRSIDTATLYKNEEGTGRAIAASGLPREDLFVTTKLWNTDQGYDAALRAFDTSLAKLGLEYVDLYLIHWPAPARDTYVETWRAFERIRSEGRAKSIGVSNFQPAHLKRLMDETDTVPAVNQIELHPRLQQPTLREFHAANGIVTEAWSPLGQGKGLLDDPTLTRVADRHGVSPAKVALRWSIQLGNVVIPKSATPSRIRDNLDLFGFELDSEDMSTLAAMDAGERVGPDPDTLS